MRFKDLCEELDKVLRLDVGFRGVVDKLYYAARSKLGRPLVEVVAELASEVKHGRGRSTKPPTALRP